MKKKLLYLFITSLIAAAVFFGHKELQKRERQREHQAWVETLEHTASHNVQVLPDTIAIDYLGERRTLALYLPEGYATDSVDYPVIYFLDGQSPFDQRIQGGTEWEVDEVIDSIGQMGGQKAIVVGIYNSDDRLREYKPFASDRWYSHKRISGDQHAEWIAKTLKPWVDARYRTQVGPSSTIIGGASLGGLMSYYILMEYPEVFGGAIVFSPSFWVHEKVYSLHENNEQLTQQRIYFNAGQLETPTVQSIEKMHQILLDAGLPPENMRLDVEEGEGHWHMTWRKGFRKAYPWIITG